MARSKQQASHTTGPTIQQEISRCSKLNKHEYAPTQYDKNDKLIDDAIRLDDEQSFWESFVDSKQAKELARRLAIVEAPDYMEGDEEFLEMDDEKEEE